MADLSRPLSLKVRRVDIHVVLDAVLRLVRYDKRFRSIEVHTNFDDTVPPVELVEDSIFAVLLNLTLNAADAMPEGGILEITVRAGEGEIEIDFRDTGHGISEEDLERIFEPYFTTKEPGRGTGLGLTLARGVLRDIGGDVEVESELGKGSTFRVRIPMNPSIGANSNG
jgi:signal transduction histidine kinase